MNPQQIVTLRLVIRGLVIEQMTGQEVDLIKASQVLCLRLGLGSPLDVLIKPAVGRYLLGLGLPLDMVATALTKVNRQTAEKLTGELSCFIAGSPNPSALGGILGELRLGEMDAELM